METDRYLTLARQKLLVELILLLYISFSLIIKLRQVRNKDDKRGKTIEEESKKTKVSQGKMKSSNTIMEKKDKGVMKKESGG